METHLVVARYNEPLQWVSSTHSIIATKRTIQTTIYNKGSNFEMHLLDYPLGMIHLPLINKNRDGGTLLHHLHYINTVEVVPDELIFLQGDPFPHLPPGVDNIGSPHFLPYYLLSWPYGDYVYLNGVLHCDLNGRPHHMWDLHLSEAWHRIQKIAYGNGMDFKRLPEDIIFSPGMSQIIPRICMTAPAEFWGDLTVWMNEHEDRGWQIERLWPEIFKNIKRHNGQETS